MFDAIIARKARLEKIIEGAGKQPREDLITSAIFGTLRLLTPLSRSVALRCLADDGWDGDCDVYLWPFIRTGDEQAEPDVVLRRADGQFWIVEVKWGAGFQPDQIQKEIRVTQDGECLRRPLPAGPRQVAGYTLLGAEAKHTLELEKARNAFPELPITSLSWPEVAACLSDLIRRRQLEPGLKAWAEMTLGFLLETKQGRILSGWGRVEMPPPALFHFA